MFAIRACLLRAKTTCLSMFLNYHVLSFRRGLSCLRVQSDHPPCETLCCRGGNEPRSGALMCRLGVLEVSS